jgi:hypothetical protein
VGKPFWLKSFNFFLTDTQIITYYQILRFGSNLLVSIILSKFFFNTSHLNQYETIVLSTSTFVFFWNTGIVKFFQSYYPLFLSKDFDIFLQKVFNTSCILGLITATFFYVLSSSFNTLHLLISLKIFTSIVSNPLEYYALAQKKNKKVFFFIHFYFIIFIVWTIFRYLHADFCGMLWGWIFLDLVKILYYHTFAGKIYVLEKQKFFNLIFLCISALLSGGVEYINFWMVKNYYSEWDFLVYRYGAREIPITAMLAYSLSATLTAQIQTPKFSSQYVKIQIIKLFHYTFPLAIFLMVVSKPLFEAVFGSSLVSAHKVFDIFLLITISRVMLFDAYLLANQKHKFFLWTASVEIFIVSLVSWIGVYFEWSVEYLAFSIVMAYFIERLILFEKLKEMKIKVGEFFPWGWWLFYSLSLWAIFILKLWI